MAESNILRIEALSDEEILIELKPIMDGQSYSWQRVNYLLQEQLDRKVLEFTLEHGDVIFEWNNLCDEKREWDKKGRLTVSCAQFYRDCLINLKIIPILGGIEIEESRLISTSTDKSYPLVKDLRVLPKGWEDVTTQQSIECYPTNDEESSSWSKDDSEESEYEGSEDSEFISYSSEDGSDESEKV